VIDGFEEALLGMPTGARWNLFVPPALAYGERGAGRTIPPNATLVFEVELIAIGRAPAE
jgi:FKBP-type peptidyl-prolyl cis-trans isomerase